MKIMTAEHLQVQPTAQELERAELYAEFLVYLDKSHALANELDINLVIEIDPPEHFQIKHNVFKKALGRFRVAGVSIPSALKDILK